MSLRASSVLGFVLGAMNTEVNKTLSPVSLGSQCSNLKSWEVWECWVPGRKRPVLPGDDSSGCPGLSLCFPPVGWSVLAQEPWTSTRFQPLRTLPAPGFHEGPKQSIVPLSPGNTAGISSSPLCPGQLEKWRQVHKVLQGLLAILCLALWGVKCFLDFNILSPYNNNVNGGQILYQLTEVKRSKATSKLQWECAETLITEYNRTNHF